ncbi:Molybdenum cofactor guanylyltransferase [bioreactor metagenome]|uniref:Molybdenum cofactor guanylyltransferase n=1 Tax=bioreactor metagenome TaxID=1076179 RepID=A0A645DZG3_9ZZZZ|nr:nucleotidyltransferase family protein [Lutispora sp.]MEA4963031.1 nucleotidyltransferase family protein [Lutispora sp.]HCJ57060.1 molybdopterin-guanine dinucleotide biosynthesis protein A [Clostridiaceae bacterium]
MNAIVLAGEKKGEKANAIENKALLKINDKYMIDYVLDSLRKVPQIDKIAVVGDEEQLSGAIANKVDYIIQGTDSIIENIMIALDCFTGDKEILLLTCDIPMITHEALEHFIKNAREKNADLCYSIVEKSLNDERYPEVKRTYAKLKEGEFTGGNVFYFNPEIKERCRDFADQMLKFRKSPAKMAGILGFVFLIKLALGILTIDAIKKKCDKLLNINAAVVISPYPEIGNDVDKISDIEFVKKYL